jgi:hypothetical protein
VSSLIIPHPSSFIPPMTTFNPQQPSSNGRPAPRRQRLREIYHVLVECHDEREQRRVYEELKAKGLKCRVLTL